MTTIDRDSIANLGILAQFDAIFRPAAALAAQPDEEKEPQPEPACIDCGGDLDRNDERCEACRSEFWKQDDYGMDDPDDRICHNLYDRN